ncbi:MAG TPA: ferritin-like domain-containing protein [Bdellovibrionota bacterium]|nr:ferritin-like domain-containing protein [Bdellovibrionota bacterium]
MLVPREELRFDFKGASFDLSRESDRRLLGWIFNQFLYGEVTGIQCGHWLYRAPSLHAASFLAKQAGEELSHVRKILRIFSLLGEQPGKAHPAIVFLSTGMMGGGWGEHVALEMALGEGLVLGVFYAMADTIPDPEIKKILEHATVEEERHVEFGERETLEWIHRYPKSRKMLLGLALVQVIALKALKRFVVGRLLKQYGSDHPVMGQFGAFYDQTMRCLEARVDRLGLSDVPISQLTATRKLGLIATVPFRKVAARFTQRQGRLTATYLQDAALLAEAERFRPSESESG